MKRLMALGCVVLMCLAMMLGAVAEGGAPAQPMDTEGKSLGVVSQCLYQGELLVLGKHGLYLYAPATGGTRAGARRGDLPMVHAVASDGERAIGVSLTDFVVQRLDVDAGVVAGAQLVQLSRDPVAEEEERGLLPEHLELMGNTMYALYRPNSLNGYGTHLVAWDVDSGQAVAVQTPDNVQAIAAYRDGLLLAIQKDEKAEAFARPEKQQPAPRLIKLYPDENTPLQPKGIEARIVEREGIFAATQEKLKTATGEQRAQLEADLKQAQDWLESQLPMRYHVSPDVIARYRDNMLHAFVESRAYRRPIYDTEFAQLFDRWLAGNTSLDQYLREADGKLRMMRLEDQ